MRNLGAVVAVLLVILAEGCGGGDGGGGGGGIQRVELPPEDRTLEVRPGIERTVEESDIFKLSGSTLFVENAARGLAVIDVTDPDRPSLASETGALAGKAGELYLHGADALVVFKESRAVAGEAEVVAVASVTTTPVVAGSASVRGILITSRLIGDILYLVTVDQDTTFVTSISVADSAKLAVLDQRSLLGVGREAHMTDRTIYVAQLAAPPNLDTRLRVVDISDPGGAVKERGEITLRGLPQGRFHMDEQGTTFRIVTFSNRTIGSNLYVIDVRDLDRPALLGSIEGLAPGEDLHATRFVGDRVFVVTYEQPVITVTVGGDPLWVVSLTDPANPRILGRLSIPGWSDYVFPRGDRLVAVGRGNLGASVAISLFDVANPAKPAELRRLEFGAGTASSEANTDFRGVRIVEAGVLGASALVAVPYTDNVVSGITCTPDDHVQLVDLLPDDLTLRGSAPAIGLVRRTVPIGSKLYAITDKTVAAIDVANRDRPFIAASVAVGDLAAQEQCVQIYVDHPAIHYRNACQMGPAGGPVEISAVPLLALLALGLVAARRARA